MCLKPIKLRNPTKKINSLGGQKLLLQVPCGKCAECLENKRAEWYFRSYKHTQATLKQGGYVYFDTLTYANHSLPRLSHFIDVNEYGVNDFSVFNHSHFKLFLKRLRSKLKYNKFDFKISYFLSSEYGCDDRYTHRPHYHILFFVPNKMLHPYVLSKFVSDCWQYGRTDGLPFKPTIYVQQHTYGYEFGFGQNKDFDIITKVCNYVSKYVTKDSDFQEQINKRLCVIAKKIDDTEKVTELKRQIDMFHRQSQGFGKSYLYNATFQELEDMNNDIAVMYDNKKIIRVLKLPMYYKRYLYYNNEKRVDNTRYWELNEIGIERQISQLLDIEKHRDNYHNIYINSSDDDRFMLQQLLGNRTIDDFILYKNVYKGRLRTEFQKHSSYLKDDEYNLFDWLNYIRQSYTVNSSEFNYLDKIDNDVYIPKLGQHSFLDDNTYKLDYQTFINIYTINENTDIQFKDFDKLDSLFNKLQQQQREYKQALFDAKEKLKKRKKYYEYKS